MLLARQVLRRQLCRGQSGIFRTCFCPGLLWLGSLACLPRSDLPPPASSFGREALEAAASSSSQAYPGCCMLRNRTCCVDPLWGPFSPRQAPPPALDSAFVQPCVGRNTGLSLDTDF